MLFVSPEERVIHMWMKDTLIPLDMLFLAPDGRILKIAAMAEPNSTSVISSDVPADSPSAAIRFGAILATSPKPEAN